MEFSGFGVLGFRSLGFRGQLNEGMAACGSKPLHRHDVDLRRWTLLAVFPSSFFRVEGLGFRVYESPFVKNRRGGAW